MNISQIAWRLKHEQGEGNVFFHFRRLLQQHCYWQTSRQHISHWCAPRFIRPCSMHSRRSKYTNPTPPGRCCETRVWQDTTRTVDTDAVVLATATSGQRLNINELWIAFGGQKNFRYFWTIVLLCQCFMSSLVVDTVSCFGSRGKRTARTVRWRQTISVTGSVLIQLGS